MTLEDWVIKYYGYREAINPAQEACWDAAQQAERERIKKIIYEATDCGRGNYELLIERIG